jgi:hypothetical protein
MGFGFRAPGCSFLVAERVQNGVATSRRHPGLAGRLAEKRGAAGCLR